MIAYDQPGLTGAITSQPLSSGPCSIAPAVFIKSRSISTCRHSGRSHMATVTTLDTPCNCTHTAVPELHTLSGLAATAYKAVPTCSRRHMCVPRNDEDLSR
jgi:hypothetical protein